MNTFAQALSHALDRCIAARTVYNQGDAVGFLYREEPVFEHDSGWRFFSGEESDEYAADPANFTVCSVSEIVQANPAGAPLLEQPAGGAWEAAGEGGIRAVADWQPQDRFPHSPQQQPFRRPILQRPSEHSKKEPT